MMDRIWEILNPKDNGGLLRRLVVAVPKKKDIVSRLEMQ